MILHVLEVQIGDLELLHETDHLGAGEVAEGVAGRPKINGRGLAGLLATPRQRLAPRWRQHTRLP